MRGEGAILYDGAGDRVMAGVHPLEDLAPRDVVAAAISRRMAEAPGGIDDHVYLDATAMGEGFYARFPSITEACREIGLDPARDRIPVAPAAHFTMGGILTSLHARTSLPGLLAVGEVACTGVHGANRLASNSLLEAAVFADRAARALGDGGGPGDGLGTPWPVHDSGDEGRHAGFEAPSHGVAPVASGVAHTTTGAYTATTAAHATMVDRGELQALMWAHAGLERSGEGLAAASARLDAWHAPEPVDRRTAEDRNLLDLARLTVAAALARTGSVGAHFRTDDPTTAASAPAPALEEAA